MAHKKTSFVKEVWSLDRMDLLRSREEEDTVMQRAKSILVATHKRLVSPACCLCQTPFCIHIHAPTPTSDKLIIVHGALQRALPITQCAWTPSAPSGSPVAMRSTPWFWKRARFPEISEIFKNRKYTLARKYYIHNLFFGMKFPEKLHFSYKNYFSGIKFPKITYHVFVCDSEHYMEKNVWELFSWKSNLSYMNWQCKYLMYLFFPVLKALACGRQSRCLGWTYKLPGGQTFSIKLSSLSVGFPQRRPSNLIKRPRFINSPVVRFINHPACSLYNNPFFALHQVFALSNEATFSELIFAIISGRSVFDSVAETLEVLETLEISGVKRTAFCNDPFLASRTKIAKPKNSGEGSKIGKLTKVFSPHLLFLPFLDFLAFLLLQGIPCFFWVFFPPFPRI